MSDEPTERDVEMVADSIAVCFSNVSDLPEWMRVPALGQDMRPLTSIAARAVLATDWFAERIAEASREGAAEALRELPVSLVEQVRSSDRAGVMIARDAGITPKHLSQMLNHHVGSLDAWVRVLRAAALRSDDA